MGPARTPVALTATIAVLTAAVVAIAASVPGALGLGLAVQVSVVVVAAVAAVLVSAWWVRRGPRPSDARVEHLPERIRALPDSGDVGDDAVLRAASEVFADLQGQIDARAREVRLLTSLIERSPNGVLVCGPDGRIRTVNGAFRSMFEIRGEPVGSMPTEVLAVPEVQAIVDRARQGEDDGQVRTVSGSRDVVLRPILAHGGEVGVLAVDVSRYRAAERARTEFVANVSHELRTPMAAIIGYAETLAHDAARMPEDMRPLLEALSRNSKRMRDTFEGLMHLARVEARAEELTAEPLRLEPLIVEALVPAVDAAGRAGIDFELDCPEELAALTNAEALDVILGNLVMNAVKYTQAGGRIVVRVRRDGEQVRIDVEDTGIGIEPAHQTRVFERFFRVDEGRAREIGGSGLGLAMVKHLARATGAQVSVNSAVGEGSTFTVYLQHAEPIFDDHHD